MHVDTLTQPRAHSRPSGGGGRGDLSLRGLRNLKWTFLAAEGIGKNIRKTNMEPQSAIAEEAAGGGRRSPRRGRTRGQDYISGKTLTFHMFDTNFNYTHSDIL